MTHPDASGDPVAAPVAPSRRRGRLLVRLLGVVVVVLVAVLAYQVTRTTLALREATGTAATLQEQLSAGDLTPARDSAERLVELSGTARSHSDGVLWRAATVLPVLGDDAAAVRDLAAALDEVAGAAPAGLSALEGLSGQQLRRADGGVDLDVVRRLQGPLGDVRAASDSASQEVADLDPDRLVGPLGSRAEDFLDRLRTLRSAVTSADTAAGLLPQLLGGDGPRRYLLVFQNNAEIRSTGGLPGAFAELRVRDGRLRLGRQGSAGDLMSGRVDRFLPGEREVFGPLLLDDVRDANFTPDFPRAASLLRLHAQESFGGGFDGVLSLDPVTLARLLEATGPQQVAGVRLTADTALRQLLLEPYQRFDGAEQDAFFAVVARGLLDGLLASDASPRGLLTVLTEAVEQRRLLLWSADAAEQRELAGSAVAGALPGDTGRPEVGIYLSDAMGAKIQYFLRYRGGIESLGCDADGRQRVLARMELVSQVPEPVSALSASVTGDGSNGPRGQNRLVVRMYAPVGGQLEELSVDGGPQTVDTGEVYDREVTSFVAEVDPGERTEIEVVLSSGPDQTGPPRLQWTPGMTWGPSGDTARATC